MAYCPECRFEYRAGVRQCPDCGAELVAHLPEARQPESNEESRQVVLCTVHGGIHAHLLQDALASQGIPSRTQVGDTFRGALHYAEVIGAAEDRPYRVYVNQRDLAQAQTILSDLERHPPSEADLAQEWPEVEEDASEDELDD